MLVPAYLLSGFATFMCHFMMENKGYLGLNC